MTKQPLVYLSGKIGIKHPSKEYRGVLSMDFGIGSEKFRDQPMDISSFIGTLIRMVLERYIDIGTPVETTIAELEKVKAMIETAVAAMKEKKGY